MAKHYNSRVRHKYFQVGDLVLRKVMSATRDPSQRKLGPNWEGPYRITSWQRKGAYHLEILDGKKLYHSWNVKHLKKYNQQMIQHTDYHSLLPVFLLSLFTIFFAQETILIQFLDSMCFMHLFYHNKRSYLATLCANVYFVTRVRIRLSLLDGSWDL